ncbi:MAG: alpha/beta hydrolase family protein [Patescibacteria group bacterium]
MEKMKKIRIIAIIFVALVVAAGYLFYRASKHEGSLDGANSGRPERGLFNGRDVNTEEGGQDISKENTEELFPFSIPAMREKIYPGSEITIVERLPDTLSYEQYLTTYESEGLTINALLTVPIGEQPEDGWPVIIFNHGYIPPEVYRTTERYEAYVDGFARNGYVVFKPDYRGHGSSEGEPGGAYFSPGYTEDVLNAVSSVKKLEYVDTESIGMWGHSMGGYLTLRAMVIRDDIQAGVIWAGVIGTYQEIYDFWQSRETDWKPSEREQNARRRSSEDVVRKYGVPSTDSPFWRSITPVNYINDISGPLQLHQGTADKEVPVVYHRTVEAEMKEAGKTVEAYEYEGADHNLSGAAFGPAMDRSIMFFDQYLK